MKRKTLKYMLPLIACVALLAATTHTAFAAKGGKAAVAITFDDLAGDAIQSDGLGTYEGKQTGSTWVISTGNRTIYFDFSNTLTPGSLTYLSGEIENVTMTVILLDETTGTVEFEFSGPNPDGLGSTDFSLTMSVSVTPSSNGYLLEASSDAELWWLARYRQKGPGVLRHSWVLEGIYEMAWGGEVSP